MKNKMSILIILCTLFILSFFSKVQASTDITRISGDDRYKTSIEICKNGWNEAEYVILASGENFPDALCAAPLAKKYNAPIILTDGKNLNSDVSETLSKLHTKNILIIGGNGSISEDIESSLKNSGYSCKRIYGNNRFQTSTAIAKELGNPKEAVVVNGKNYPDGLSVSPAAAMKNIPILLVDNDSIDESIKNYLKDHKIENTYIVGGTGVVNTSLETYFKNPIRIAGDDRYCTNIKVFQKFFDIASLENSFLASGEGFPDALAGSALSSKLSKPLLLTDYFGTAASFKFIEENKSSINKINVIGGGGTLGCVGFPEDKLLNIMMWMDPTKNPSIIMGPTSQLEKM